MPESPRGAHRRLTSRFDPARGTGGRGEGSEDCTMHVLALPLLIYYLAIIAVVSIYGIHRYWVVWAFLRGRRTAAGFAHPTAFAELPRVTVQLPMFNERRVAQRVIEAACAIDYPRERLQIQVLDDSTDQAAGIAADCCERMRAL